MPNRFPHVGNDLPVLCPVAKVRGMAHSNVELSPYSASEQLRSGPLQTCTPSDSEKRAILLELGAVRIYWFIFEAHTSRGARAVSVLDSSIIDVKPWRMDFVGSNARRRPRTERRAPFTREIVFGRRLDGWWWVVVPSASGHQWEMAFRNESRHCHMSSLVWRFFDSLLKRGRMFALSFCGSS